MHLSNDHSQPELHEQSVRCKTKQPKNGLIQCDAKNYANIQKELGIECS